MISQEISAKLMFAAVRKFVFDRLGLIKKQIFDEVAKDLTPAEKLELAAELLVFVEKACREFVMESDARLKKERAKTLEA